MKASSKVFIAILSVGMIGAFYVTSSVSMAAQPTRVTDKINLCAQLNAINTRIQGRLNEFGDATGGRQTNRDQQLNAIHQNATQLLTKKRSQWDTLRTEHYQKLGERATTDQQKQALQTYREMVEAAVVARRAKVDSAINDFRGGLDNEVNGTQSSVYGAIQTYKDAVNVSLDKAKQSCDSGADPTAVRTTLVADLQSAREQLDGSNGGIEKIQSNIEQLRQIRRSAIEAAIEDFRKSVEVARNSIIQIFGN